MGMERHVMGVEEDLTGVERDLMGVEGDVMGVERDVMGLERDVMGLEGDLMVHLLCCAAVSIVERDRQVLKSTGGTLPRTIVPRSASFCQHTFVHKLPVVMVVEDTFKDERWAVFFLSVCLS